MPSPLTKPPRVGPFAIMGLVAGAAAGAFGLAHLSRRRTDRESGGAEPANDPRPDVERATVADSPESATSPEPKRTARPKAPRAPRRTPRKSADS